MSVLLLGPCRPRLVSAIEALGERVVSRDDRLAQPADVPEGCDFLVSYGFRHLIPADVIARFEPGAAVNLHISLLPWNRGADPNLWSYLEDTPKGVTIHCLDEGLDTGDILLQEDVVGDEGDTLASSYRRLGETMEELLLSNWAALRSGETDPRPQRGVGSVHRSADKERYSHLLRLGWDTPVAELIGKAKDL